MREVDKIIVNTDKRIITIYFKENPNSSEFDIVNYEFSSRFKLVVDTIKRTIHVRGNIKNENKKT